MGRNKCKSYRKKCQDKVVVVNRADTTVSLLGTGKNDDKLFQIDVRNQVSVPPTGGYTVSFNDELWVGFGNTTSDPTFNQVWVWDTKTLKLKNKVDMSPGNGVFHMMWNPCVKDVWVSLTASNEMGLINRKTKEVKFVQVPQDLKDLGYVVHDVTLTPRYAYVTMLGSEFGGLLRYDLETLETEFKTVPKDPHVFFLNGYKYLYVACQEGFVFRYDPDLFSFEGAIEIPGAHGITGNRKETRLYIANTPAQEGQIGLYVVDLKTFEVISSNLVYKNNPHNLVLTRDESELYVTHSYAGSTFNSIYAVECNGELMNKRIVESGLVPFGVTVLN